MYNNCKHLITFERRDSTVNMVKCAKIQHFRCSPVMPVNSPFKVNGVSINCHNNFES